MEEKHFVSRKRLAQAAALAGAAGTLLALLLSALSGALAVRLFRYLGQARRTNGHPRGGRQALPRGARKRGARPEEKVKRRIVSAARHNVDAGTGQTGGRVEYLQKAFGRAAGWKG